MSSKKTELKLGSAQVAQLLRVAGEAGDIASPGEFRDWAQSSVRKLFPHDALIAGVAHRQGERVGVERLVSAGFPMSFIDAVMERRGTFACPTLEAWFRQGRPQLFEPGAHAADVAPEFRAHQLKNVAAHGVLNPSGDSATYFSFSQIPQTLTESHALLLELLAPLLHRAYMRAMGTLSRQRRATPAPLPGHPRLTRAEVAVLRELYVDSPTRLLPTRLSAAKTR